MIDPDATMDREEADECRKMHGLIEEHGLQHCLRWTVAQKNRVFNGELYRYIADTGGAFAQPALYEGVQRGGRRWQLSCRIEWLGWIVDCGWPRSLVQTEESMRRAMG